MSWLHIHVRSVDGTRNQPRILSSVFTYLHYVVKSLTLPFDLTWQSQLQQLVHLLLATTRCMRPCSIPFTCSVNRTISDWHDLFKLPTPGYEICVWILMSVGQTAGSNLFVNTKEVMKTKYVFICSRLLRSYLKDRCEICLTGKMLVARVLHQNQIETTCNITICNVTWLCMYRFVSVWVHILLVRKT